MPNALLDAFRGKLADRGIVDDRPDFLVMRDILVPLAQKNPQLLDEYPDFAREYGEFPWALCACGLLAFGVLGAFCAAAFIPW